MQKRRLVGASALGILIAVGLSGCLKVDMQLDLQSDDTVDGSMLFAISSAVAELAGESPESIAEQMQQDSLDLGEGGSVRTEPYNDGEFIGSTTYFEDKPLSAFDDPESVSIVREGDEFVVSGAFDLSEATGGDESMPGLTEGLDVRISVKFPGPVSSHNGMLEGNTVTWQAVAGERLELEARGSAVEGGGGFPILLLIGIGFGVLLLAALILFLVLRSKKRAPAVAPATAYPTAGGYPATPPPPAYAPQDTAAPATPPPPAPPESQAPATAAPPAPPEPPAEPSAEPKADEGPPPPPQA